MLDMKYCPAYFYVMLKYYSYGTTFAEVPDEVSLYITLSGCRIRCPECNSKWLWKFEGTPLTPDKLLTLIHEHSRCTCICIGGGDDFEELNILFKIIKKEGLKSCWYTGYDTIPKGINLGLLDYIKIGHFNGHPLNDSQTNQRMFKIHSEMNEENKVTYLKIEDITYVFYNKDNKI